MPIRDLEARRKYQREWGLRKKTARRAAGLCAQCGKESPDRYCRRCKDLRNAPLKERPAVTAESEAEKLGLPVDQVAQLLKILPALTKPVYRRTCPHCDKPFKTVDPRQRYCKRRCQKKATRINWRTGHPRDYKKEYRQRRRNRAA